MHLQLFISTIKHSYVLLLLFVVFCLLLGCCGWDYHWLCGSWLRCQWSCLTPIPSSCGKTSSTCQPLLLEDILLSLRWNIMGINRRVEWWALIGGWSGGHKLEWSDGNILGSIWLCFQSVHVCCTGPTSLHILFTKYCFLFLYFLSYISFSLPPPPLSSLHLSPSFSLSLLFPSPSIPSFPFSLPSLSLSLYPFIYPSLSLPLFLTLPPFPPSQTAWWS